MTPTAGLRAPGRAWLTAVLALATAAACRAPRPGGQAPAGATFTVPVAAPSVAVEGIWADGAYAYVIASPAAVVLVDAGGDPQAQALQTALRKLGRSANDVVAILLTHYHTDHRSGAAAFPNATVYLGEADFPQVAYGQSPRAAWPKLRARFARRPPVPPRLQAVLPGERLHVADLSVDCFALPGHTAGSMAYRLSGVVFVGDSVDLRATPLGPPPAWVSDHPGDARRAVTRLLDIDCSWRADGHVGARPCQPLSG